jgi:hypothetical protein
MNEQDMNNVTICYNIASLANLCVLYGKKWFFELTQLNERGTDMKVYILLALCFISTSVFSQEAYLELLRSDLKANKVAIITAVMDFSEQEADVFWPIYREYELELSKLGDQRVALIKDYADNFTAMTDEKAKELVEESFDLKKKQNDLLKKYFKKMDKVLPTTRAARFAQLENQILMMVDLQIASELPLLEKAVKSK